MRKVTRLLVAVPAMVMMLGMGAPPSVRSIPLPNDFSPEGIAAGSGSTLYVGSLVDGDIYRTDLRGHHGKVFIDAPAGRTALGMKYDKAHHRLWVAGGPTGHAYVYDTRTGRSIADLSLGTAGASLINDVVITTHAAYFTDSFNPVLYKVPIGYHGWIGRPHKITLSGPAATIVPGGFNLNGIAAPNDHTLIADHSALGTLVTINPRTGSSHSIQVTGGALTPGSPDGILLHGRSLYVVENFAERLVTVKLGHDFRTARITSVVTDADVHGAFRIPTAVAEQDGRLALVNARFDVGLPPPLGTGVPAGTDYNLVVLKR
ncbi:YncE family protein [Kribbella monticola]|uniref:hypothetical protein n=1 Tax=Kribbella monticola TaxID=2185285 RepID=UPI000DD43117|nr:hypothetical protein [Kribbella monticola]